MKQINQYGNIVFTESGISMSIAYGGEMNIHCTEEQQKEAFDCAIDHLRARMQHCLNQLNTNAANATFVSENMVCWKNGHFSRPVYDSMADASLNAKSWDDLNRMQIQQIVRALHFNGTKKYWGNAKDHAFNIATEILLCMLDNAISE